MKTTHWKDYAELIGIAAIVASLIFVGQQLRLERQVAVGEGLLQYEQVQISLSVLISDNSELWLKGLDGAELSPVEQLQFDQIAGAIEARFLSRYQRSVIGIRSAPADSEARRLAHDMYLHKGLRDSLIKRWQRYPDGSPPFQRAVMVMLERFDSGELSPSGKKVYSY